MSVPIRALVLWSLTLTTAYLGWNQVGATWVRGVQGRYFLPFAALPMIALHLSRRPRWAEHMGPAVAASLALILGLVVQRVFVRYYGGM